MKRPCWCSKNNKRIKIIINMRVPSGRRANKRS